MNRLEIRKRIPGFIDRALNAKAFPLWFSSGFAAPAPSIVKRAVVRRNSLRDGVFVETGTFFGDMTASAAKFSKSVVTIEPAKFLYDAAVGRFSKYPSVKVINAPSEEAFPELLPTLSGPATFWLDGHYSGGITYLGEHHTPLALELECLSKHMGQFSKLVVMIDDIGAFGGNPAYPPLSLILHWAEKHGMNWQIEHDIMVLRSAGW